MLKRLKKNKGFTGIDISISVIIILIFIPTIFGIVYNIQKTNESVQRKTNAVGIATNIIEIIKKESYDDISENESGKLNQDLLNKYAKSTSNSEITEDEGYNGFLYYSCVGEKNEHYVIQVGIKNYYPSETEKEDLIKQINVKVFYPYGSKLKNVEIGTVAENS